jgi:UDP-N-acetylglucosamine--N-acetylmuramyl-(pentapeptide) pyrophosphoryl-undecaprenol N-acetylglucosamine transferase
LTGSTRAGGDGTSGAPADGRTWALVAGGGTAGHTLPGIAVARALVDRGHPASSVHFVGSRRGSEARLVPDAGFEITLLPGRGIERKVSLQNVGAVFGLLRAQLQAFALVRRLRPEVVLALGGFASVAAAFAAIVLRIPIVVAEQNARAGLANRLVAKRAVASAVAFEGTGLPRARLTGNPVRAEILAVDPDADRLPSRVRLGLPEQAVVLLVFGGSLGSRHINEAVFGFVEALAERGDVAVHHVIGSRDWDEVQADLPTTPPDGLRYHAVEYEEDMASALAAADVVLARAGATTVAELTVVGRASVLVPLPIASEDHQTKNAESLTGEAGAALLVPDGELSAEVLVERLGPLLDDPATLARMGDAARALGRPDAADRVADLVEDAAGGNRG